MWRTPYIVGFAVLVVLYGVRWVTKYLEERRFKKEHGCQPCPRLPQSERIMGLGLLMSQRDAAKKNILLQTSLSRFQTIGHTWSASIFGKEFINTIDPENIKTILATNFDDWGLGKRIETFGPLLGEGIFTTDGKQWEHSRVGLTL